MVFLNENISFNIKSLKKRLTLELQNFMEEYEHIIKDDKLNFLKDKIEEKVKSLFSNDHFVYLSMDNNLCTYKYKRGKNEGYYCCKRIRTNLPDDKKDYLCSIHSKKHIPKKKKKNKNKQNNEKYNEKKKEELDKSTVSLNNVKKIDKLFNDFKENTKKDDLISNKINNQIYKYKSNIYKDFILNDERIYKTLLKEFPLLDFCINKIILFSFLVATRICFTNPKTVKNKNLNIHC